jgi:hypothetical protein
MEAARTSEMSVNFYQTKWHYNPEDRYLQQYFKPNYGCISWPLTALSLHILEGLNGRRKTLSWRSILMD